MEFIINLDQQITNFTNLLLPHNQFFDYFFTFFSLKGNSFFIWAAIIILVLIFVERKNPGISKRDVSFISVFLISFLIATLLSQVVIKNIIKRPRPCAAYEPRISIQTYKVSAECLKDYSFPSSHAATAFAAATVISVFDKKRKWFYFLIALLISLSRIYLGYHYFFDVVAGGILGWIISRLTLNISLRKLRIRDL